LKRKKYHTIRTVPKSNKKIIETLVKLMHIYMTAHLPVNQIKANLAGMVLGWSPYNIVSDSPALHPRTIPTKLDFGFRREDLKCDLISKYAYFA
jgi:hypothetical protein